MRMLLAVVGVLALILGVCSVPSDAERIAANRPLLDPVVDALVDFQSETGDFPATLDDLVPVYLPEEVFDSEGREFVYHRSEFTTYVGFYLDEKSACTYDLVRSFWECSRGSE